MTPTCPWISLTPRMKADRVVVVGKQGQSGKMHPKNIVIRANAALLVTLDAPRPAYPSPLIRIPIGISIPGT